MMISKFASFPCTQRLGELFPRLLFNFPQANSFASKSKDDCPEEIKESEVDEVPVSIPTPLKGVKVAILGAAQATGCNLSMLLKSNKYVKDLGLFDMDPIVHGVAKDLTSIPTRTKVTSNTGIQHLKYALQRAHIVVILGGEERMPRQPIREVFENNADYVYEIAQNCVRHCPEAMFVINVEPINAMVPLFASIMEQNGQLCPERIIGDIQAYVVCAKKIIAQRLDLDASSLSVQIVGGASKETMVPLVSSGAPEGIFNEGDLSDLASEIRSYKENVILKRRGEAGSLSGAYATSKLVTYLAQALCGEKSSSPTSVYIRNSAIRGVSYLVVPVLFGFRGVEESLGVPKLRESEKVSLENAIKILKKDIELGEAFAENPKIFEMCEKLAENATLCTSS